MLMSWSCRDLALEGAPRLDDIDRATTFYARVSTYAYLLTHSLTYLLTYYLLTYFYLLLLDQVFRENPAGRIYLLTLIIND